MCVLKVKIMSPFKLGDFLGKLMYVELKKYFPKKRVAHSSYSHRTWRIAGIVKCAKVGIPTMHPSDRLAERNTVRSMKWGWSKDGQQSSLCDPSHRVFYLLPVNIWLYLSSFTILISANNKVISVKEIPLLLVNDMDSVIKIYEPTLSRAKKFKINPEQTLGVEVGIDMWGVVEPQKVINYSLFNFEESITEIFYRLFNKPVAIQLREAIRIPITVLNH